ncbi:hypothetical protein HNQ56_000269 [Anaerotaenia torta]|uniref:hypothetical protein n=1 Tax=Anaerotaenia torta TaxID=433293 RepID=UPI003D2410BC
MESLLNNGILLTATATAVGSTNSTREVLQSTSSAESVTVEDTTNVDAAAGDVVTGDAAGDESAVTDGAEGAGEDVAGEDAAVDESVISGEDGMAAGDGIIVDDGMAWNGEGMAGGDGMMGEGMMVDPMGAGVKDPLLSSWPFVIGISCAVLAVSIVLGALLAKLKIKKGIELYED